MWSQRLQPWQLCINGGCTHESKSHRALVGLCHDHVFTRSRVLRWMIFWYWMTWFFNRIQLHTRYWVCQNSKSQASRIFERQRVFTGDSHNNIGSDQGNYRRIQSGECKCQHNHGTQDHWPSSNRAQLTSHQCSDCCNQINQSSFHSWPFRPESHLIRVWWDWIWVMGVRWHRAESSIWWWRNLLCWYRWPTD